MFKSKKKEQPSEPMDDGQLTETQRMALEKQQEQARALRRLEAEFDLLGRRT